MDDRVNFLRREHVIAELFIADVALIEPRLRMHGLAEARLQIVRHDNVVTIVNEFIYGMRADVTGTA